MNLRCRSAYGVTVALLLLAGCGGKNAPVAANALKLVPDNALAVIVVKDLTRADKLVGDLGRLSGSLVPSPYLMTKGVLGIKEGIDDRGTLVIAAMPGAGAMPEPFVAVPVTDYQKFIAQLKPTDVGQGVAQITLGDMPAFAIAKGQHAIIAVGRDTDAAHLAAFVASKNDISSKLAALHPWLAAQDAAAIATHDGVKTALAPVRQGLEQAKKAFPPENPQSEQVLLAFGMYEQLFQLCEAELEHAGIGMRGDDNTNMHLTSRWQFKADSPTSKLLTGIKPASGKPFADLPNSPAVMAFAGPMPEGLAALSQSMLEAMAPPGKLTAEQKQQVKAAMDRSLQGVRKMSMAVGVPRDGASMYSEMVGVMAVADAEKYIAEYAELMKPLGEVYQAANIPGWSSPEIKKVEVGGRPGTEFTMDIGAAMKVPDEKVKEAFGKLFGPDGKITFTYVASDKQTLLAVYGNAAQAAGKVAAYRERKGSLHDNGQIGQTMSLLLKDAQWHGIWDIPNTLKLVTNLMKSISPDTGDLPLPTIPACPPLGFAVQAGGGAVETDLVVPAETIKTVAEAMKKATAPNAK